MSATFPNYLGLMHGFPRIVREPAVLRTEMESGPPKQAMIRSSALVTREVQYVCKTLANYQSFKAWFVTDIARGADWFFWPDPEDDVSKLARIVGGIIESEEPNKTLDVWVLKFRLETWDA